MVDRKKTDNAEQETRRMANIYGSISADVNSTKQEIKTSLDQLPDRMAESFDKRLKKLIK
jgi:hypothetical protein